MREASRPDHASTLSLAEIERASVLRRGGFVYRCRACAAVFRSGYLAVRERSCSRCAPVLA